MKYLALMVRSLCHLNRLLGQVFSWFTLAIVLVCFTVVVLRYIFSIGFVWMQDLYVWLNGAMFMGIAGYTLLREGHVRVDVFYRTAPKTRRAWIDIGGALIFITPFIFTIVHYSTPYVLRSWSFMEGSSNYGGMPGLYVMKSFILVFAAVIALQGLAMIGRSILVLKQREDLIPEDYRYEEHA
ncbi:TRAP transporter small permease subunit [Saccharospirillum mangrovi]|uniref:TRAP transporter small permease subunit n=1 Tax=Saccharospirillum mangrovi TaxID=2161747 RepID=UPI000D3BB14F|nr:TRAP transporter small permease subunit [Saccharospirillum mangrovi]